MRALASRRPNFGVVGARAADGTGEVEQRRVLLDGRGHSHYQRFVEIRIQLTRRVAKRVA